MNKNNGSMKYTLDYQTVFIRYIVCHKTGNLLSKVCLINDVLNALYKLIEMLINNFDKPFPYTAHIHTV